jgi:hypothetical protein
LVNPPGIKTDVADGTPEGLQLPAVFQFVLVAPVQVFCAKTFSTKNKEKNIKTAVINFELCKSVFMKLSFNDYKMAIKLLFQ